MGRIVLAAPGAPIFLGVAALAIGTAPAAQAQVDQAVEQAIANQTTVMERFEPRETPGTVNITVVDQRDQLPDEEARDVRFTLASVTVEGAETVPLADLEPAWAGRIGSTQSIADLYDVADAIEAAYLRAGYFSKVVVPVQDFASGRIVIRVYESYVAEVTIESDVPGLRERLAPYIDRLTSMHPIDIKEAERVLLLMSDLGGVSIDGTFTKPDTPTGGGALALKIGFDRAMGQVSLDNFGSASAGPLQATGVLVLNDLLQLFGTSTFVGLTVPDMTEELTFIQGSQEIPIGYDGLNAGFSVSYVSSRPPQFGDPAVIDVSSTSTAVWIGYPFLRTIDQSVWGRLQLNMRDDDVDVDGVPAVRDRLRWLEASLRYDQALPYGFMTMTATAGFGIDGMGATTDEDELISRPGVPPEYRFARLDFDAVHALWDDASVSLKATGQIAMDPLPGALQMSIGGDPYGRAFDPSSASGDTGFAVTAEIAQGFDTGTYALSGTEVFAFVDYGVVVTRETEDSPVPEVRQALGSAGFGVRATIDDTVNAQVLIAIPWEDELGTTEAGTEFYFTLSAVF